MCTFWYVGSVYISLAPANIFSLIGFLIKAPVSLVGSLRIWRELPDNAYWTLFDFLLYFLKYRRLNMASLKKLFISYSMRRESSRIIWACSTGRRHKPEASLNWIFVESNLSFHWIEFSRNWIWTFVKEQVRAKISSQDFLWILQYSLRKNTRASLFYQVILICG